MPVSTNAHISHGLSWILEINPKSVLDVGCGFGLWGFLCREYLDVMNERVQPTEWQVCIDGIELFEPYIQAHQRALYTNITIGDIRELAPCLTEYELIIAGDVIEHLQRKEGEQALEVLYEKATKALLVNIPLEGNWEHPERHGNPGELHRSTWCVEDFAPFAAVYKTFTLPCGTYGSFLCRKDAPRKERIIGLLHAAERAEAQGDLSKAAKLLHTALPLDDAKRETVLFLADVLIRLNLVTEAMAVLERAVAANPGFHYAYLALAKLLLRQSRNPEARAWLTKLVQLRDVPAKERADAEALMEKGV
ncbi:MAG: tetratricopeptide repeat protein [Candidatus Hydrogenedentes bacterium]|nr:tetratricopeptide repeat protein [Candidatus Hydrogenedentota bacterium]